MKYSPETYINFDFFTGEEAELTLRTVKLVKVRKEHLCFLSALYGEKDHKINKGEIARYEKALVDSDYFGSYYMCLNCCDEEIDV